MTAMTPNQIEAVVQSIMYNFPDASMGLACMRWKYDTWEYEFLDDEGKKFSPTKGQLIAAFPLIRSDKWLKGLTQPPVKDTPEAWDEWLCQADANDFDAFLQLAIFKEVIYG